MNHDIYCFLCGSEMEFDTETEMAECPGCMVKFECYVAEGKVEGLGISKESHEQESK